MNLPLSLVTFVHVGVSLVELGAGFALLGGMLASRDLPRTAAAFLLTSGLTTATGFLFPLQSFTPAVGVGIVATLVLIVPCGSPVCRRRRS